MTIKELQEEIIDDFNLFDDWMERYEFIIDNGKSMPKIEAQNKSDDNIIKGCQSKVWLHADYQNGKVLFTADSDAILTKGIISLLLKIYNDQSPDDILGNDPFFIDEVGLKEHLSPTRANGLLSMVKQIKLFALAFKSKNS